MCCLSGVIKNNRGELVKICLQPNVSFFDLKQLLQFLRWHIEKKSNNDVTFFTAEHSKSSSSTFSSVHAVIFKHVDYIMQNVNRA